MENKKRHISHNDALEAVMGAATAAGIATGVVLGTIHGVHIVPQAYTVAEKIADTLLYTISGGLMGGASGGTIAAAGITIYEGINSIIENVKEKNEDKKKLKKFRNITKPAIEKDMRGMII